MMVLGDLSFPYKKKKKKKNKLFYFKGIKPFLLWLGLEWLELEKKEG